MTANRLRFRIFYVVLATGLISIAAAQPVPTPSAYNGGLVPFEKDGKWGYADGKGNTIIAPQFAKAGKFSEGLAAVYTETAPASKVGVIDSRGTGRPFVQETKKWGFISESGQMVIAPEYEDVDYFSEGLAAVSREWPWSDLDTWGYINKQGEMVIKPQFNKASPFSEGLALVEAGGVRFPDPIVKSWVKMGYIDKAGQWVIASKYWYFFYANFSEGAVPFRKNFGKWGYMNQRGKVFIRPQFDWAGNFLHGLAPVVISGNCTRVDKGGHMVGPYAPRAVDSSRKNYEQDSHGTYIREPKEPPCN